MSITREEAIANLEKMIALFYEASIQNRMMDYSEILNTLEYAAAALRGPTKEMVERMRGKWEPKSRRERTTYVCSKCGEPYGAFIAGCAYFCPSCGAPMRRAAVDMMQEMWKGALKDGWV